MGAEEMPWAAIATITAAMVAALASLLVAGLNLWVGNNIKRQSDAATQAVERLKGDVEQETDRARRLHERRVDAALQLWAATHRLSLAIEDRDRHGGDYRDPAAWRDLRAEATSVDWTLWDVVHAVEELVEAIHAAAALLNSGCGLLFESSSTNVESLLRRMVALAKKTDTDGCKRACSS